MSGRRTHPRFTVHLATDARLRVFRDIHVQHADAHELVAISPDPAPVGQRLSIDTLGDAALIEEPVEVIESSPVSVDGSIRHRLRLRRLAPRLDHGSAL